MSLSNNDSTKKGTHGKPLLKRQILEAQRHTNSNAAAARYLQVDYDTYRKYAKLYDVFDQHLNPTGIGIDKGWSKRPNSTPLHEILQNKHPHYSRAKLKNRLLARKKLLPQCKLCHFSEARITDHQVPLMLAFHDNNPKNMALDNLYLLCYNCMFLTTGAPAAVYRAGIRKSFTNSTAYIHHPPIVTADYHDPHDEALYDGLTLTDMEKATLLAEQNEA